MPMKHIPAKLLGLVLAAARNLARIIHEEPRGEQELGVWAGWWAGGCSGARFGKAERSDLVVGMVLSSAVVVLEARWPSGRRVARMLALVVRLSSGS
jgi:hypothetical protein